MDTVLAVAMASATLETTFAPVSPDIHSSSLLIFCSFWILKPVIDEGSGTVHAYHPPFPFMRHQIPKTCHLFLFFSIVVFVFVLILVFKIWHLRLSSLATSTVKTLLKLQWSLIRNNLKHRAIMWKVLNNCLRGSIKFFPFIPFSLK